MKKIDLIKTIGLAGTVLGIVSTAISSWSQQKDMERTVAEKVDEALNERENYTMNEEES